MGTLNFCGYFCVLFFGGELVGWLVGRFFCHFQIEIFVPTNKGVFGYSSTSSHQAALLNVARQPWEQTISPPSHRPWEVKSSNIRASCFCQQFFRSLAAP